LLINSNRQLTDIRASSTGISIVIKDEQEKLVKEIKIVK
jgi:hypothetical protein